MNKIVVKLTLFSTLVIFTQQKSFAQDSTKTKKWFVGYETLEMSMNSFRYFAGEIGYRINPKHQVRLVIGQVKLTEAHLANKWQSMGVDGPNVNGYFGVYELNYDRFFGKRKNWYYGANAGYKNDRYNYLLGPEKINNHTATVGFQIGYQKMNLFKIRHLYINFSSPTRYYFHPIKEQKWGNTRILTHSIVNNIWFFVGYNF